MDWEGSFFNSVQAPSESEEASVITPALAKISSPVDLNHICKQRNKGDKKFLDKFIERMLERVKLAVAKNNDQILSTIILYLSKKLNMSEENIRKNRKFIALCRSLVVVKIRSLINPDQSR